MADAELEEIQYNDDSTIIASDREFNKLVIKLYRENQLLWDPKHEHYTNKVKRKFVMQKIVNELKVYRPDYNTIMLKKKINVLRTNFNKAMARKSRSMTSSDEGRASLWYIKDMMFLKDIRMEKIDDSRKRDRLSSEEHYPDPLSTPSQSIPRIKKEKIKQKKRKHYEGSEYSYPSYNAGFFDQSTDYDCILTKGWALKLSRLAPDQRKYAEQIINDTLFEGAMGTLTASGVCFLSNTSEHDDSPSPSHEEYLSDSAI